MSRFKMECQRKNEKGKWETTHTTENKEHILEMFANDLTAKYIGKATYVKSIRRNNNYDGTATYIVTYNWNDCKPMRTIYIVSIYC